MDQEYTVAIHQASAGAQTPAESPPREADPRPRREPPPAPVLGWLVCVQGEQKGVDLPITRESVDIAQLLGAPGAQAPSAALARNPATGEWTVEAGGERRILAAYDAVALPGARLLFLPYEDAP